MAKNLLTEYPGKVGGSTPQYPYGEPRDVITNGDGTGTPWQAELIKDIYGLLQAILTGANITPSNTADNAVTSQYLEGLRDILGQDELLALAPSKAEFEARNKGKYAGSGFVHWGKTSPDGVSTPAINEGMSTLTSKSNTLRLGRDFADAVGVSTTPRPFVNVNNSLIEIKGINFGNTDVSEIKLPPAPDGLDKRDGTGRYDSLADAIAAGTVDLNESVINRQDLVLFEVFHEKISDKDVVYPRGLVQYGVSTWEGINLQTGNVAQGYSAQFEGDTATTGRSAVWSSLSEANKAKFIQDPLNNIYSDNGELIQVRARARVIRGLEGSWEDTLINERSLHSFVAGNGGLRFSNNNSFVKIQGKLTSAPSPSLGGDSQDIYLDYKNSGATNQPAYGTCSARSINTDEAHGAELRVIPICLVDRLNQGAYHPVFNSQGVASWVSEGTPGYLKWNQTEALADISSRADCLTKRTVGVSGYERGNIATATSGRPDGGLYDSIKAGQIKDLRIDASGTHTPQTAHHTLSKRARNGEARGWEKLPRIRNTVSGNTQGTGFDFGLSVSLTDVSLDVSWIPNSKVEASGWLTLGLADAPHKITHARNDGSRLFLFSHTLPTNGYATTGTEVKAVFGDYIDAPYSEGLFQNVTGTPAEIAATFPNGVLGEWIPVIPDGTSKEYKSTKKNLETYLPTLSTNDSGVTWTTGITVDTENTDNSATLSQLSSTVRIVPFRAKANFTEEFFIDGLNFLHSNHASEFTTESRIADNAIILAQSVAGIIPTDIELETRNTLPYSEFFSASIVSKNANLSSDTIKTIDSAISSAATSDGIQWETIGAQQDELASLIIPYRQIKHDGTSYGAGLTFNYVNNTSNALDDNGELIQVGTARSLDDMNIILKENFNV